MSVTEAQVVKAAVQLERDGRAFYLDVAAKTRHDLTRKMFESLADDELDHIAWLEKTAPGVDKAATANRRLYERLRPIFLDVPEAKLRRLAASESDVDAIELAIDMETKSVNAYEGWAAECDGPAAQTLCNVIAAVERFHRLVLTNTLEYFEHTGDWFMEEEQWNFEGA